MAIDRLESTLRALVGKIDPAELKATLSVRLDDDRTLRFSIDIPKLFKDHQMSFARSATHGVNADYLLSELSEVAHGIYPTGIDCRLVFGFSAEGLVMDAVRKYPALREHFGSSLSDKPATYELNSNILADIKMPARVQ